jgi:hypothetical protein
MFLAFVWTLFCESALMEFLLDRGDRVRKGNWLRSLVLVCGRRVFALTLVVLLWSESLNTIDRRWAEQRSWDLSLEGGLGTG